MSFELNERIASDYYISQKNDQDKKNGKKILTQTDWRGLRLEWIIMWKNEFESMIK